MRETAEEIINRLEAKKNYIPSSDRTRKQYSYVLLKEYRKYVASRKEKNHKEWGSRIGPCAEEMTPLETCDALRPVTPSGIAAQLNVTRATMFKIWS